MARVPVTEGNPTAEGVLTAVQFNVEDLENVLQRAEVIRVNDTNYIARLYYVGDNEFDALAETWDP